MVNSNWIRDTLTIFIYKSKYLYVCKEPNAEKKNQAKDMCEIEEYHNCEYEVGRAV